MRSTTKLGRVARATSALLISWGIWLTGCIAASAAPLTLYVSPAGNDAWTGRLPDANAAKSDGPFATIQRARDEIRKQKAAGQLPEVAAVVLRGGTYRLAEPLVFTPEDSGTPGHAITYSAASREKPVLSGGRVLRGWTKGQGNLWQIEIPEVRQGKWYFNTLFVNGQRCPRARTPNDGYLRIAGPVADYPKDRKATAGNREIRGGMKFKPGDINPNWHNLDDVNLIVYHSWTNSLHWIDRIDDASHVVRFTNGSQWPIAWWDAEQRYHVENVREGLDAPGEWYLDRKTGLLEYYPRPGEDMARAEAVAPVLTQLVRIEGKWEDGRLVHDLVLRGLSFQYTDWSFTEKRQPVDGQGATLLGGAVQARGAERLSIENCEIAHVGGYGLWLEAGCKHNRVQRCEIHDLGAGGVRIGEFMRQRGKVEDAGAAPTSAIPMLTLEGTGPRDTGHNTIDNNFIHDGCRVFTGAEGVLVGHSAYNQITHNEICDLNYTGVSVGWIWGFAPSPAHHNRIVDNHIHHLGWGVMSDMGGFYSLGPSPGTVVAHNLVHHINAYSYGGWGLYTDEGSSGIVLENNVVYDTKTGGFHQHYGADNIVRNNIFAFSREGQIQRSREDLKCSFTLERNIVYCDNDRVLDRVWNNNDYKLDYNDYWTTVLSEPLFGGRDFPAWQAAGQDQHSFMADPRFVDAAGRDFRLPADSPALKLGFQPIDVAGIGLYGDKEWVDAPKRVQRPEFVLPATALPMPKSLEEGFESTPVGRPAVGARTMGEASEATIRVTDEMAAAGKHSLKFTDAAGLPQVYNPHLFYTLNCRRGIARGAFDVRLGPGAALRHEWRDEVRPYHAGPSIQFDAGGELRAGRAKLMTVPLDKWIHVEIVCGLGAKATGTFDLAVTIEGQEPRMFDKLPCGSKDFRELKWYGFMATANQKAVFYLDNLALSTK